ncbi:hypothetical protein PZN02_003367 [Sinorhizobium garamanticum]|uniref:Uncharacterized protein n=1 Tax=Sinorhizobium garamanticum TaxID=680247 RepID=A0ABY8DD99_9HYPH|nr:hypothetical protein [Sinorhizobium garamanticum]WEX87026.1 hypothetical protein PZN02_003367 [Sinorhizobium garamanticum]
MAEQKELSAGTKVMVMTILVSVAGLFLGVVGLIAEWPVAKGIGICSGLLLALVFWLSANVKSDTLDRFLFGRRD